MGKSSRTRLIGLGSLLWAVLSSASVYAGDVRVENAWARATVPGQDSAMVDMTLASRQGAALTGVSSTAAGSVTLHRMAHENGMMKMREAKSLELPAGKRINLGESGYHLMLSGLKAPLRVGDTVPLTLTIRLPGQRSETIETGAEVRPLTATRSMPQEDGHGQHHH